MNTIDPLSPSIRCYDPCLSCSTHAVGQMPMQVRLIGPDGRVPNEITRG